MKNKIEYLLKHNMAIQAVYKAVMSAVFKGIGFFIKTDDALALFSSYSGKRFDDSPHAIFEEMRAREECKEFKFVWAFNSPEDFEIPEAQKVKMDSLSYFITALKAKYWITNVNIERGLHFKKRSTVYLNTWHGTGAKKVGNAVSGRNDYDFSSVDIISSDGPLLNEIMIRDFNANEDSLLLCGRPREDSLYAFTSGDSKRIRSNLGISEGAKVVLYAPTWRESTDGGLSFDFAPPVHIDKWKSLIGDDTVILFRAHSIMTKVFNIEDSDYVIDCSDYQVLNELMFISDILISDYSGIFMDFSIQGKPIFSFAFDFDEYMNNRGVYFDTRDYITTFYDEDSMIEYLHCFDYEAEAEKAKYFFNKFAGYGGNASKTCVDRMLEIGHCD